MRRLWVHSCKYIQFECSDRRVGNGGTMMHSLAFNAETQIVKILKLESDA